MATIEIDNKNTQHKSERSANKDRKSDSKAVCVPGSSKCENRTARLQVTEWMFVCAVNKRHTNQKVRMYREKLH